MKKKTIYITGAGGMIGSHLAEFYNHKYRNKYNLVCSYLHPTVNIKSVDYGEAILKKIDIRNEKKVFNIIKKHMPDVIIHLAAQSFPVVSWNKPHYTFEVNVGGTINIFESILNVRKIINKKYDPKVVVITSSAIYGDALKNYSISRLPDESCELLPLHPYGVSKASQDLLCYQYYKNYDLDIVRVRLFNCTGTRKNGDVSTDFAKRAIKAMKSKKSELIVGNLHSLRAILDVRDLCYALNLLVEKGVSGEAYNISSSHIFKVEYVVDCLEKILNYKFKLVVDQSLYRPADEPLYAGNTEKIRSLGWEERYEYLDTLEWIVNDLL